MTISEFETKAIRGTNPEIYKCSLDFWIARKRYSLRSKTIRVAQPKVNPSSALEIFCTRKLLGKRSEQKAVKNTSSSQYIFCSSAVSKYKRLKAAPSDVGQYVAVYWILGSILSGTDTAAGGCLGKSHLY